MESHTWVWVIDTFASLSDDTVLCMYVFPLLLLKKQVLLKLIYTDDNGRLVSIRHPEMSQVLESFRQNLHIISSEKLRIKGYGADGTVSEIRENEVEDAIECKEFVALQAVKECGLCYHHVIEFKEKFYQSFPFMRYFKSLQKVNDVKLEKMMLVYSVNGMHLIEKHKECNVNKIEFVYWQDVNGRLWLEKVINCFLSRVDLHRTGVLQAKVQVSSIKYTKISKSQCKSVPMLDLHRRSYKLKPKKRISNLKLFNSILPRLSEPTLKVCYGYYCTTQIDLSSITRSRKVSARQFCSLSHKLIKKAFKFISFPLSEAKFSKDFTQIYSKMLKVSYSSYLQPSFALQSSDKPDQLTLCPVCFKIFTLASVLETPQFPAI